MVLFPAKTAELKFYLHSEKLKLYLLILSDCKFHYLFPPAALKLERFASSARERNWIVRIFSFSQQPYSSVLTSFGCWSICLCVFFSCGASKAPTPTGLWEILACERFNLRVLDFKAVPAKESRGGGGEKLCLFTSKAMAALRWFSPPKRGKNNFMATLRWSSSPKRGKNNFMATLRWFSSPRKQVHYRASRQSSNICFAVFTSILKLPTSLPGIQVNAL